MAKQSPLFLDEVDAGQPALNYAVALQQAASSVGFDWSDITGIIDKIHEETDEVTAELAGADPTRIQDEIGDLLFAITNLARHLQIDPQRALQQTNQKFRQRFAFIEMQLQQQGKTLQDATLMEMDELWEAAKHQR
ncbi:MAG: MazG nucleotide pyrophosphohydrolase domain-containing protein [Methylophaga sp.]|nr:MazG nucleotide pyrophosphohydrolase domain-containing protein [Methylophaga sp.]